MSFIVKICGQMATNKFYRNHSPSVSGQTVRCPHSPVSMRICATVTSLCRSHGPAKFHRQPSHLRRSTAPKKHRNLPKIHLQHNRQRLAGSTKLAPRRPPTPRVSTISCEHISIDRRNAIFVVKKFGSKMQCSAKNVA